LRLRPGVLPNIDVFGDWSNPLSTEKSNLYLIVSSQLETAYAMFSVNLDEAIGMRRDGHLSKAYKLLSISPALCQRLTEPLLELLHAMRTHGNQYGTAPNLETLNPSNFLNSKSQRAARQNHVFTKILLTQKRQFLFKTNSLADLVEDLRANFLATIDDLGESNRLNPDRDWQILDADHYDLNTCLRESFVVLKCFLHAIPPTQLLKFELGLKQEKVNTSSLIPMRARQIAHGRMTLLKGQ
jgi:hypothetical protein